jgi:hypothetical protein
MKREMLFVVVLLLVFSTLAAQQITFDINVYKQFLSANQNMSGDQLRTMHPAGFFKKSLPTPLTIPNYFTNIDQRYALTMDEKSKLQTHGFVVTERMERNAQGEYKWVSFGSAVADIWESDLPIYISSDLILHALHMSYDEILKQTEHSTLIPKLKLLLAQSHASLSTLDAAYGTNPTMRQSLLDVDLYLTLARSLLEGGSMPYFSENQAALSTLLSQIAGLQPLEIPLFSSKPRTFDFSQFTIRGHYTETQELGRYFQSMIWLGRTELYLIAPKTAYNEPQPEDIRRQIIDAALVVEALKISNSLLLLSQMEDIIRFFVGDQDNVTVSNMLTLMSDANIQSAAELTDTVRVRAFLNALSQKPYAFQLINSQILFSDPMSPDQLKPASAFLLLGQRFVVDSYVTGSVVYDKILFNNEKMLRMLPSPLDILFAIGNNAALQLLKPELDKYNYGTNLAALRYLVDGYDPSFWTSSIYNGWLQSIRALNPPADRSGLPQFMQAGAWWQKTMNTQLASWAQLRHDNLLYAKQSYSAGVVCSFPESYVEPVPDFFNAVKLLASNASERFGTFDYDQTWTKSYFTHYFNTLGALCDTLGTIAQKELSKTALSDIERAFLRRMLFKVQTCGIEYDGWLSSLFLLGESSTFKKDYVVADVHTAPTDASGAPIGWVLHAGTGPINLAVINAELADGTMCSFVGPVMSYYEHLSVNYKRLTDEEWQSAYQAAPSLRPSFVNLYLTDSLGNARPEGLNLQTSVGNDDNPHIPATLTVGQNFPNPFNASTVIPFSVPASLSGSTIDISVYDVQGRKIKNLFVGQLPAGNYTVRWDGTNDRHLSAASGIYFYHINCGGQRQVGKMALTK